MFTLNVGLFFLSILIPGFMPSAPVDKTGHGRRIRVIGIKVDIIHYIISFPMNNLQKWKAKKRLQILSFPRILYLCVRKNYSIAPQIAEICTIAQSLSLFLK